MNLEIILALLAAAVQMGTPILLATLGEIVTERGGILNLGVEGIMSVGALAAFAVTLWTGSPVAGLLAAGICGALLAGVHGLVCLGFQGNQVVSGLALTILGVGLANYFGTPLVGSSAPGFHPLPIPGLSQVPILGRVFFRQDVLVYMSILIVPLLWFYLFATRWGLGLRAAGENPEATSAAGLHTIGYRWVGVLVGGWLMGWGGAYLSLAYTHSWTNGLTAGRGWIAVALVIFAFWRPYRALLGAFLFGGVMAFQFRLQAVGTYIPSSLLMMLPYALTIIVLVLSSRRGGDEAAPAALGINIEPAE
jgi:general nucleoside transport system permease protein